MALKLLCPGCSEALLFIDSKAGPVDQCPRCGGIWIGLDRLEEVYRHPEQVVDLLTGFELDMSREAPQQERTCPRCRFPLRKTRFRVSPVEGCPVCGELWVERVHLLKWNFEW